MNHTFFRVGDIVEYNKKRSTGYVIEVRNEEIRVVSDKDQIQYVNYCDINKQMKADRKAMTKDKMGNTIKIDDTLNITNPQSKYNNKKGIVKCI